MKAIDLLAFGPHPDDVEISAAGTLIRMKEAGHRIGICDLTGGEMGTRGSREIRAAEAQAASRVLGLDYRCNLDLGDGRLLDTPDNRLKVLDVIRACRPRVILNAWHHDDHPDHEAGSRLVKAAHFMAGMSRVETEHAAWRAGALLYYPARQEFRPSFVVDISAQWERRREAAMCYKSQFHDPQSTERKTQISSPDFWNWVEGRAMYYGQLIGASHGEAFFVEKTLAVADPVALFGGNAG